MLVLIRRYRLSDFARELYGGLVGFGTAVADEGTSCAGEATGRVRELDELLREQTGVWVMIEVRRVHELSGLCIVRVCPHLHLHQDNAVPVQIAPAIRLDRNAPMH